MAEAGFFTETAWMIPAFAALAFVSIAAFGHRTPEKGGWLSLLLIGAAGAWSLGVFANTIGNPRPVFDVAHAYIQEFNWWSVGDFSINFGIYVDNLTAFMLFVVGILVTLIAMYSIGYMHEEGSARRRYYFAFTLFITGMLGLVVSSNYLMLFLFWEIMGLCSYLLIGYWFTKPSAAAAAKKAFMTTRVGDAFFLVGLGILFIQFRTLDFDGLIHAVEEGLTDGARNALFWGNLFVFLGAVGKSAQFPLHVWLPDAMEGPTTVSALIHAATMVKAGVYLVARSLPLYMETPTLLVLVAVIGAVTALFAASMALVNNDIKRVLAYSTLSQLGYMFLGLGLAGAAFAHGHYELAGLAFVVAIFHLFSHAFFKAGLFLSAGSVGHATHTYDMRLMGGLRKHMPVTGLVMLLGTMSIAGVPFFSGFFSKDEILHEAFVAAGDAGGIYWLVYGFGLLTAGLTAYYMFRLYFMTFEGDYRGHDESHLHESPKLMTIPLMLLGAFAVLGGIAMFFILPGGVEGFLHPHFAGEFASDAHASAGVEAIIAPFTEPTTYVTLALAALGIGLAWAWWKPGAAPRNIKQDADYKGLGKVLYNRWYIDPVYATIFHKGSEAYARVENWFDQNVVDGIVNGIGSANHWSGERIRRWNTGNVQDYAVTVVAGFLLIMLLVIYHPHAVEFAQRFDVLRDLVAVILPGGA